MTVALAVSETASARCWAAKRRWTAGMPRRGVGVVHDVVVDQGCGLKQLEAHRRPHEGVVAGLTGAAGAPVAEGRTQSLAAGEQVTDGIDHV